MQYKITLSSTSPSETIYLNDEKPYLKLLKLKIVTDAESVAKEKYGSIVFSYTKRVKPGYGSYAENVEDSQSLSTLVDFNNKTSEASLNKIINTAEDFNYSEVELSIEYAFPEIELEIWYEMEKLYPFQKASHAFKQHLENNGNIKILFSGPFGTGKTTFLREFFSVNACYELFHLFPVNYSVATNEDIFRYLKAELLFLLLEKGVEFDKQSIKKTETVPAFLKDNALNILLPFTRLIPQVGKSVHDILEELMNLKNLFESYHEEIQVDDERKAKKFIKELYEQEGSVFEDNFYTQIIRQLLEKIKAEGKQTILVIDDLDRIDPEHVFRILNIFAAQFDQKDGNKVSSNKFGFDRIVLVCHYENLKKIFQHKYGLNTDFSGYVDKYFSKSKFEFDSREINQHVLSDVFTSDQIENLSFLGIILLSLADNNLLTLREAIKLAQGDMKVFDKSTMLDSFVCLKYMSSVIDIDSIIERFKESKHSLNDFEDRYRSFNYEWYFKETLADLLFYGQNNFQPKTETYKLPDQNLEFVISASNSRRQPKVDSFIIKKDGQEFKKEFYRSDLFAILEQVAIRFKQLKG